MAEGTPTAVFWLDQEDAQVAAAALDLVVRTLAHARDDKYGSKAEVLDALRRVSNTLTLSGRHQRRPQRHPKSPTGSPRAGSLLRSVAT